MTTIAPLSIPRHQTNLAVSVEVPSTTMIASNGDVEVVELWVTLVGGASEATESAYRAEANRFLLWLSRMGLQIRTVQIEHVAAFERFLRDPPVELIGPRRRSSSSDWRPFAAPLSERSVRRALSVISSLYSFLEEGRWIEGNPVRFYLTATRNRRKTQEVRSRSQRKPLSVEDEAAVTEWMFGDADPNDRWCIGALLLLGLRVSELCSARMCDLRLIDGRWYLRVIGKGTKPRDVAVSKAAMDLLHEYRSSVGLQPEPKGEDLPLVGSKRDHSQSLTRRAVHKRVTTRGYEAVGGQSDESLHPHRYRHTAATRWLAAGANPLSVRDQLGHGSVTTTEIYLDRPDASRHADTAGLDDARLRK